MAEMTEAKIYEALGLEMPAPADTGANVQEPAEPVQTQSNDTSPIDGANGQEVADPAEGDNITVPGTQSEPEPDDLNPEEGSGADGNNQPQTPEERRVNAARRRQQEQQQAVDAAVAAARQEEQAKAAAALKDLFEKTGMKNTITGEPITTMEEMQQWQRQMRQAQLEKDLKAGKITPEALNQMIEDHPMVQKANEIRQQQESVQSQQAQAEAKARIDGEIAEIGKMDPTIRSAKDLLNMPKAKEFYDYVQKGYSFLDSYKLSHFEEITQRNAEAARQKAQAAARGKEHLTVVGNSRNTGAATVPGDQMQLYRMLNPGASEADIQKHFNKYQKRGG